MADDDVPDPIFDDEADLDWMYIEETSPLADELAETSVPDPGYAGTNWELENDSWLDFDFYQYWDDLEYGDDTYWDSAGAPPSSGRKRKKGDAVKQPAGKRRKLSLKEQSDEQVAFVSMDERRRLWSRRGPVRNNLRKFALLPDWRKRCAKADKATSVKAMPEEMKQAAEGNDEKTPEGERHFDAEAMNGEEGDWEDEDEADAEAEVGDMAAELANLDPEMLKSILRQKMGDAGLEGMDEGAFMQTISKMLAGDEGADDATGDLANSLLGQASQGENSALSGWLSQQGVSLDHAEEEEDDTDSVATAEIPASSNTAKKGKGTQVSPPDSAIEMSKTGHKTQMAMHDGSPKSAKKRLAPIEPEDEGTIKKRKTVTFDVPASQETHPVEEGVAGDPQSSEDPLASAPASAGDEIATSDDPIASEPTVTSKSTRSKNKAIAKNTKTAESNAQPAKATRSAKAKTEPGAAAASVSAPAKATRKRKAQADEGEPSPPKKHTKKAAGDSGVGGGDADDGKPSYARATRSTRARNGK